MHPEHHFCVNEEIFLGAANDTSTSAANHSQNPYAILSPNKVFNDQINASGERIAKNITNNATKATKPLVILYSNHLQIHQNHPLKNFSDQGHATCAVTFDESFLCLLSKVFSLGWVYVRLLREILETP